MTDPSGNMAFGYDARGRLVEKTSIINSQIYTISRSYTPGSRISSVTYPTGRTIDYDRTTCACGVGAAVGFGIGYGFSVLTIYDLMLASEYFEKAIEDFRYKDPCE